MSNILPAQYAVKKVNAPLFHILCRGNNNHKICKDVSQYFYNKIKTA